MNRRLLVKDMDIRDADVIECAPIPHLVLQNVRGVTLLSGHEPNRDGGWISFKSEPSSRANFQRDRK